MAVRIQGQITGLERSVQDAIRKLNARGGVNLKLNDRGFTQPLGRITAQVSEFNKSLEASNARVIAFGAAVGILNGVKDAFEGIVRSTVRVEKALADVNVVLNASSADLQRFSKGLFDAARNTGQSFNVVTEAATEFARQGLSIEETLRRTNDALILTRLTGMDAAESVKSLTAAMNTFQKAGLTSTQVISKMAAVDVEFAVSADDLAAAISRTGQSAVEAGVSIDQLIGLVTAAQQRTARGGAVIGNAFKTILTRIRRPETLKQLEQLGIAVRDVEYNTLPAVQILNNLAATYDRLSDAQKSQLGQTVAGVFQINILKAALADASSQNSILARATQIAAGASDEAVTKNEKLNQTLDALGKQTVATFTEVAKSIGDIAIGPGLKNILQVINSFGQNITDNIDGEGAGAKFFQGFLRGLGNIVTGPGVVLFGAVVLKLFAGATKFASNALKDVLGITTQAQRLKGIQEGIIQALGRNTQLQQTLLGLEGNRTAQERVILELIKQQTNALASQQAIARSVAPSLAARGVGASLTLPTRGGRVPNLSATTYSTPNFSATTEVPNFASPISFANWRAKNPNANDEKLFEAAKKGEINKGDIHGFRFQSKQGEMPNNQKLSNAITDYNKAGGGLTPEGIVAAQRALQNVPGTAKLAGVASSKSRARPTTLMFNGSNYATVVPNQGSNTKLTYSHVQSDILKGTPLPTGSKIGVRNLDLLKISNPNKFKKRLDGNLDRMLRELGNELTGGGRLGKTPKPRFNHYVDQAGGPQLKGRLFEAVLNYVGGAVQKEVPGGERWDFPDGLPGNVHEVYEASKNNKPSDAKFNMNPGSGGRKSMIEKIMLEELKVKGKAAAAKKLGGLKLKTGQVTNYTSPSFSAWHYDAPNFSAVGNAIKREVSTGVPRSAVRVATHSSLKTPSNPRGMGVFNTLHEPKGLSQGIRRARSERRNPRTYGMPNFAIETAGARFGEFTGGVTPNPTTGRVTRGSLMRSGFSVPFMGISQQNKQTELEQKYNRALQSLISKYEKGIFSWNKTQSSLERLNNLYGVEGSARKRISDQIDKSRTMMVRFDAMRARQMRNFDRSNFGRGLQGQAGFGVRGALGRFQSGQGRGVAASLGRGLSGFGGMGLMMGGSMIGGFLDTQARSQMAQGDMQGAASSMRLSGATTGMSTGASIGMMFGPIGIAAGAAAGALLGFANASKRASEAIEEQRKAAKAESRQRAFASANRLSSNFSQLTSDPEVRSRLLEAFPRVQSTIRAFGSSSSEESKALNSVKAMQEAMTVIKNTLAQNNRGRNILFGQNLPGKDGNAADLIQLQQQAVISGGSNPFVLSEAQTIKGRSKINSQAILKEIIKRRDRGGEGFLNEPLGLENTGGFQDTAVIREVSVGDVLERYRTAVVDSLQGETKEMIAGMDLAQFSKVFNIDKGGKVEILGQQLEDLKTAGQSLDKAFDTSTEGLMRALTDFSEEIGDAEIKILTEEGKAETFNRQTFLHRIEKLAKESPEALTKFMAELDVTFDNELTAAENFKKQQEKIFTIEAKRNKAIRALSTRSLRQRLQNTSKRDLDAIRINQQLDTGAQRGDLSRTERARLEAKRRTDNVESSIFQSDSKLREEQSKTLLEQLTRGDNPLLKGTARDEFLNQFRDGDVSVQEAKDFINAQREINNELLGSKEELDELVASLEEQNVLAKETNQAARKKNEAENKAAEASATLADQIQKEARQRQRADISRRGRLDRLQITNNAEIQKREELGMMRIEMQALQGRGLSPDQRAIREQNLQSSVANERFLEQRRQAEESSRNQLIQELERIFPTTEGKTATFEPTAADLKQADRLEQQASTIQVPLKEDGTQDENSKEYKKQTDLLREANQLMLGRTVELSEIINELKTNKNTTKQEKITLQKNLKALEDIGGASEDQAEATKNALGTQKESNQTADKDLEKQKDLLQSRTALADALRVQKRLVEAGVAGALTEIQGELDGMGQAFGYNTTMAFMNGLEDGLNGIVDGSKSAKDAFMDFAFGIYKEIQRMMSRKIAAQITQAVFGGQGGQNVITGLSSGAGITSPGLFNFSNPFKANTQAPSYGAPAPNPRASLSSSPQPQGPGFFSKLFGGIRSFLPFNKGGSVPALVQGGEYLFSREAVNRIGAENLIAINSGKMSKFQGGGFGARLYANPDAEMSTVIGLRDQRERNLADYRKRLKAWKKMNRRSIIGAFLQPLVGAFMGGAAQGFSDFRSGRLQAADVQRYGAFSSYNQNTQLQTNTNSMGSAVSNLGDSSSFSNYGSSVGGGFQGYDYSNSYRNTFGRPQLGASFYNKGGLIKGGSGTRDDIPMILQGGEFVMRKSAVQKHGRGFMDRLNKGMNEGGTAGPQVGVSSGGSGSGQGVNINITINTNSEGQTSEQQTTSINREDEKKLADKIKSSVMQVINEEQRVGGSLSGTRRNS